MMTEEDKNQIIAAYRDLQCRQKFVEEELDYSILEKHKPLLQQLADLGKSGISVFDSFKSDHVFYSSDFCTLLGYNPDLVKEKGNDFLDDKIHPDDFIELMKNGILLFRLLYQLPPNEVLNYKLLNEYRMLNASGRYTRVIEQHQLLALDQRGNIWLTLSIIDISPNHESKEGLISQLFNFKTGKIIPFQQKNVRYNQDISIELTNREKQILQMVKEGFLSKEISERLSISVHTVNTHRQRVLEKLGANNSMEAVVFASKLGLL